MKQHTTFYNPILPGKMLFITAIGISLLFLLLTGCARKAYFQQSATVPAARGFVKIDKDHNRNYKIELQVSNLAEVERLPDSGKTYVVWMVTDNQEVKNIGQIESGSSMFSNKLKASFSTSSSTRPTKIFITSESDGGTQTPGDLVIMTTGDF